MVSTLSFLVALFYSLILQTFAAPIAVRENEDTLDADARDILARSTPAAPHFVVYSDAWVSGQDGPPPVSEINVSPRSAWPRFADSDLRFP